MSQNMPELIMPERMTHEEIRNITGALIRIRNILRSVGWTQDDLDRLTVYQLLKLLRIWNA